MEIMAVTVVGISEIDQLLNNPKIIPKQKSSCGKIQLLFCHPEHVFEPSIAQIFVVLFSPFY